MSIAPERQVKSVSEIRNVAVSFSGKLDSGELLTGTPTIVEVTSSDLTLANKAISTISLTINDIIVPTGEAVTFNITGGTSGKGYMINIIIGTDATQTLYANVIIKIEDD